jgi:hypothetical protein
VDQQIVSQRPSLLVDPVAERERDLCRAAYLACIQAHRERRMSSQQVRYALRDLREAERQCRGGDSR